MNVNQIVKEKDLMGVVKFDNKKLELPPLKEEKKDVFILNLKNVGTTVNWFLKSWWKKKLSFFCSHGKIEIRSQRTCFDLRSSSTVKKHLEF